MVVEIELKIGKRAENGGKNNNNRKFGEEREKEGIGVVVEDVNLGALRYTTFVKLWILFFTFPVLSNSSKTHASDIYRFLFLFFVFLFITASIQFFFFFFMTTSL